jgi:hypothetical protein
LKKGWLKGLSKSIDCFGNTTDDERKPGYGGDWFCDVECVKSIGWRKKDWAMGEASLLIDVNLRLMKSAMVKIHRVLSTQMIKTKKKLLIERNLRRMVKRSQAMGDAGNALR